MATPNKLIEKVFNYCKQHELIVPGATIIVGLSGGPDSVALLHILNELKNIVDIKLIAAHLDHEWRQDSFKDREFCRQLCIKLDIPYQSSTLSELPKFKYNGSVEEIGRKARRYFLERVAKNYTAARIALGHHQDDQQETFFIRLIRGSSLTGLCSMRPKSSSYIRPFLGVHKKEILEYLDQHSIAYLVDSTNESSNYLRNRLRTFLPNLSIIDSRFAENFSKTVARLQLTEEYLAFITRDHMKTIIFNNSLSIKGLLNLHLIMQQRVLMQWIENQSVRLPATEKFLTEILQFLSLPGNKTHKLHHAWSLEKKDEFATIIQHN